jgi:hypothetical protein
VYAVPCNDPDPTVCDPPPSSTLAVTEPDVLVYGLRNRQIYRSSCTLAATKPVFRATKRTRIVCPPRPSSTLVATEPVVRLTRIVFPPRPSSSLAATERDAAGPSTVRQHRTKNPPSARRRPQTSDQPQRMPVSKEPNQQHLCWNCSRPDCKKKCPYPKLYGKLTGIAWPPPPDLPPPASGAEASDREIGDWVAKYRTSHPATVSFREAKRNQKLQKMTAP